MLIPGNQMMLRTTGAAPPGVCAYPLNDNGTIAGMFGLGFAPATGPGYQSISYVLTGTSPNSVALTAPASPFTAPALTTFTGRKGFGFTAPQIPATANDYTQPTLICYSAGVGNIFRFNIYGNGDVIAESGTTGGLTTDVSLTGVAVTTAKFGMVADADTGVVHYYIDGILVGNSNVLLDKPTGIVLHYIADGATVSIGSTVQGTLVSDAPSLATYGFTPGTTTLCGEVITSSTPGYPLDDNGALAGMFGVASIPAIPTIYNEFSYTYLSPNSPSQGGVLPSVATFGSTAQIPITGAIRGCEMLFNSLPTGDFQNIELTAVFLNGGTPTGTRTIGVQRVSGVDEYVSSAGAPQPRALNSNFRVGFVVDGNTGDVYVVNSENPVLVSTGYAIGATHVMFVMLVQDDGTTTAGEVLSASLIPNAGDMSLFYAPSTLDYQDLPCPVNPAWSAAPAPTVLSIETDTLGTEIIVTFDIAVNNSPQLGWSFTNNMMPLTPTTFSQPTPTTYRYSGFASFLLFTDTLLCSYVNPPGTVESDPAAIPLANFTDTPVTNNVPANPLCQMAFTQNVSGLVMSNFDMTADYSIYTTGTVSAGAETPLYPNSPSYIYLGGGAQKAYEFAPTLAPFTAVGYVEQGITMTNTLGNNIGHVRLRADSGTYFLIANMATFGGTSINLGTTKPTRIGVEFDDSLSTQVLRVYADNVLHITTNYNPVTNLNLKIEVVQSSITAPDIGLAYQMTYVPYAPDFLITAYTAGTVDACGNPTGSGYAYPLDDTGNTVTPLGYDAATGTAPGYQSVSYTTTQAATGGFGISIPDLDANFGQYPTLGLGTYGVGFRITNIPAVALGEVLTVNFYSSYFTIGSTSKTFVISATRGNVLDTYSTNPSVSATPLNIGAVEYLIPVATVQGVDFGMLIDTQAQRVQYYENGVYIGTSQIDSSGSSSNWYFAIGIEDGAGQPLAATVDYEIITKAAELVGFGFPPQTRDLGGDLINFQPATTYATWDPGQIGGNITLSNGNKTVTEVGGNLHSARATVGVSTGKYYWEYTVGSGGDVFAGVGNSSAVLNNYLGIDVNGHGYYSVTGNYFTNGSGGAYGATYTTGDVIGIALDMDTGDIEMFKNNVSQGVMATGLTGTMYPMCSASNSALTANFGASSFTYYPPLGFQAGIFA